MANPATLHLTEENFDAAISREPGVMMVDFWAEWCGPCRAIAPVLEDLANESAGKVTLAKVNVDENPGLAARYGIRSIPTILFVKQGRDVVHGGHAEEVQVHDVDPCHAGRLVDQRVPPALVTTRRPDMAQARPSPVDAGELDRVVDERSEREVGADAAREPARGREDGGPVGRHSARLPGRGGGRILSRGYAARSATIGGTGA